MRIKHLYPSVALLNFSSASGDQVGINTFNPQDILIIGAGKENYTKDDLSTCQQINDMP